MIVFERISFRNFLSFGNTFTTFNFDKGINRISGENGTGKSALLDAIYFALFGKPYRKINLGLLVNSINKSEMLVKLRFSIGENQYLIERGIKPNVFKIYENGVLKPLASSTRSYQDILEEEIIMMNENIFSQITAKSITRNISFLSLSKNDKRQVIENITDTEIFTLMNRIAKVKIDELDLEINNCKKDIDYTNLLLQQELCNLEQLKNIQKQVKEESNDRIEKINKEIEILQKEINQYKEALLKIEKYKTLKQKSLEEENTTRNKIKKQREELVNFTAKLKTSEAKIKLLNETCSGCSKIKDIINIENVDIYKNNINIINEEIIKLQNELKIKQEELQKIEKILANEKYLLSNIQKNNLKINELEKNIHIEVNKEIIIDRTKYLEHSKNKKELELKYNKFNYKKKHLSVIKTLLSDDGIKAYVIKKYLPYINKLLNTYLQKFNAGILFYFDNEFNEIVGTRHKENFSYFSFSEGQKRRIDLAILFAFKEFSKLKNKKANTNILILDEVTAMLDAQGENLLYEILKDISNKEEKSIITISHSGNIDPTKIDKLYNITVEKGFSKINITDN